MFEAMIYILRVGCPWRDLPVCYGPWNSVYTRWRRWCLAGLWEQLLAVLARKAVSLSLAPGPHADVRVAQSSARPKLRRTITVADKGYDSDGFRAQLGRWGSRACIPPRCNRLKPARWHRGYYRKRHKVENLFQRLKRYRRVGTRYEKNDRYFLAFVQLAAMLDWLKNRF